MSRIATDLNRIASGLRKVPQEGYRKFREVTPRQSGYAQNNTKLVRNEIINADYNYAGALNSGTSKQAPKGMTEPMLQHLRPYVKRIIGN